MVQLWEVATHRRIVSLHTGGTGPVYSVVFSPDGRTLASGSADGIRLWKMAVRRTIAGLITGAAVPVYSVAFSQDGTLASGSADGIRLWGVAKIADPLPYLCALAGRSLTRTEWAHYLPEGPAYQRICT